MENNWKITVEKVASPRFSSYIYNINNNAIRYV